MPTFQKIEMLLSREDICNSATTKNQPIKQPTTNFAMSVDTISHKYVTKFHDGVQYVYNMSALGVLTYCIPRVHTSVTEDFMKNVLRDFFDDKTAMQLDMNCVSEIDFVPIPGCTDFKKAFVYHRYMSEDDHYNHFERIQRAGRRNMWWDRNSKMNMVNRITASIFSDSATGSPVKVNFVHNGRRNFWLLLPNLNPLTVKQRDLTEEISDIRCKVISQLSLLADAGLPVPDNFDDSVLDERRVDTAWATDVHTHNMHITFYLQKMEEALTAQLNILKQYADSKSALTVDDLDAMEHFQNLMDEEQEALNTMHDQIEDWNRYEQLDATSA